MVRRVAFLALVFAVVGGGPLPVAAWQATPVASSTPGGRPIAIFI